MSNRL